jgi:hypothetical protein
MRYRVAVSLAMRRFSSQTKFALCVGMCLSALTPALILTTDAAMAASAPILTGAEGVAFLNQQREANGIPGGLVEEPHLSQGCKDYVTLYHEAPGQYPHEERPGQQGYTPAGAEAAAQSDLAGLANRPTWTGGRTNPWWNDEHPAPLHISDLFNPAVTTAWYGENTGGACMGTSGERTFTSPSFYAFPSEPGLTLPPFTRAAESPWTPQVVIGIPGAKTTGPNFVVWPEDTDATITSTTLSDTHGQQFPVSAVLPTMRAPASPTGWPVVETVGEYSRGASFIVAMKPLIPNTLFTLTVNWTSPTTGATYPQTINFKTDGQLMTGINIPVALGVTKRHSLRIRISSAGIGHPATITVKPCRIIPDQDECYGTHIIDYRRTIRLAQTLTSVVIPHLAADSEVNINMDIPTYLVGDARSGGGTDICWPHNCAG